MREWWGKRSGPGMFCPGKKEAFDAIRVADAYLHVCFFVEAGAFIDGSAFYEDATDAIKWR